jgi:peptidoglycan L-alanyl-D-glutamate endopeptidase CwlK
MPKFSKASIAQLATCDSRLRQVAEAAILVGPDFSILEGHRGKEKQEADFRAGTTKLHYPRGRHNAMPSRAFDFSPFPQDWTDKAQALSRFTFIAGVMLAEAKRLGVRLRFGFDWNRNFDPRDETFLDWGHVELD